MSSRAASRNGLEETHRGLAGSGSVQRAMRLLESAAAHEHGAPAKQLARESGLPLPTAYHLLRALVHGGYLRRDNGLFILDETRGPHPGDGLVALPDGELGHESRERVLEPSGPSREPDDLKAESPLWALDESAGTVFGGLDRLFRALGPPSEDLREPDRSQQRGEGGRR